MNSSDRPSIASLLHPINTPSKPHPFHEEEEHKELNGNIPGYKASGETVGHYTAPQTTGNVVDEKAEHYLKYFDSVANEIGSSKVDKLEERKQNAKEVSNEYYDLATDFYEYGWGEAFHFAVLGRGESREHSFAKYEYTLALKLKLNPEDLVLDVGCGIGGPARHIASFSDAKVVGINCNEYQLTRARALTRAANLNHLVTFQKDDFHSLQFPDDHFDKAYAIEATCHSPNLSRVYSEIYRVLKPGGLFACTEWIMTDTFDPNNSDHRQLKDYILEGNGLPDVVGIKDVLAAVKASGFELVEARDRALDSVIPWYSVLQAQWTLSDLKITPIGRWLTHLMLATLEAAWLAPKGSVKVHRMLCKGADGIAGAGVEGIFSPMYNILLRKPPLCTPNII